MEELGVARVPEEEVKGVKIEGVVKDNNSTINEGKCGKTGSWKVKREKLTHSE